MSNNAEKSIDKREHLVRVLKDFDTAMLFTHTSDGQMRGRPMGFAEVESDGNLYFATALSNAVVAEIAADPRVAASVQGKVKWASLSGKARVNKDRALIHRLWRDSWKLWFPQGKDDPNLCLIEFDASEGEYWDNTGATGVQFVLRATKAFFKSEQPDMRDLDENAKVRL